MNDMEARIRQLEIDAAERKVQVNFLADVVQDNTNAIKELTSVLNKGRGAAWAMAGAYTIFGGAVATLITWIKG